jgi:curved DNA-binding protein CbpA
VKTLYQVLQVSPDASPDIVRAAHRVLAARYHPDNRQTGDSQKFREVNEAYEVLKTAGDRARYDAGIASVPQEVPNPHQPPTGIPLDKILVELAANVARNHIGHLRGSERIIQDLKPQMLEGIRNGLANLSRRFGGVRR